MDSAEDVAVWKTFIQKTEADLNWPSGVLPASNTTFDVKHAFYGIFISFSKMLAEKS